MWHLHVPIDPVEWLRWRAKQKVYLARYGRQSILQWGDVDVTEMAEYYELLVEIIRDENTVVGLTEDRA